MIESEATGRLLETARKRFVEAHGTLVKNSSRRHLQTWLDHTENLAIEDAVKFASREHNLDEPGVLREISASLRFRVLAGTVHIPVPFSETLRGGTCKHQEYDPESGGWPCKVPSNQAQVDGWHEAFGPGPACPFYEPPNDPVENPGTELENLLDEGEDLYDAWRKLRAIRPDEKANE